jgi:hypothetical protein
MPWAEHRILRGFLDLHGWVGVVFTVLEHLGRPYKGCMKKNLEDVCTVINKDRRSTVSKTARRLGILYGISQGVLEYSMDLRGVVSVSAMASSTTLFFGGCSMGVDSNIPYSVALATCDLFCLQ